MAVPVFTVLLASPGDRYHNVPLGARKSRQSGHSHTGVPACLGSVWVPQSGYLIVVGQFGYLIVLGQSGCLLVLGQSGYQHVVGQSGVLGQSG